VVKQVLFGNPAYRVTAIPGEFHDPDARHYDELEWVVDGVWMSTPPADIDREAWTRISDNRTVSITKRIECFHLSMVDNSPQWKSGSKLYNREHVRNGSPFGRVGRETQAVMNLPDDNILTGAGKSGTNLAASSHGHAKRLQWLKRQSFLMRTDSISLQRNVFDEWEWVIGLTRLNCTDSEARAKRKGPVLPYKEPDPEEDYDEIPQAQVANTREGGDEECMGAVAGGGPPEHIEEHIAEGSSAVGVSEEGDGDFNMPDVWEDED